MELIRHRSVFNPANIRDKVVAVIGMGATGSAMALELAKLGHDGIEIYDDDVVADHNLPNQILYGPSDVGHNKATAATNRIKALTGFDLFSYPKKVSLETTGRIFPYAAILCVDNMKARQEIVESILHLNFNTKYVLDIRISARTVQIIEFDPSNFDHMDRYRERWYPDATVAPDTGNCGNTLSIGATAHIATSIATWLFIKWVNGEHKESGREFFMNLDTMQSQLHELG